MTAVVHLFHLTDCDSPRPKHFRVPSIIPIFSWFFKMTTLNIEMHLKISFVRSASSKYTPYLSDQIGARFVACGENRPCPVIGKKTHHSEMRENVAILAEKGLFFLSVLQFLLLPPSLTFIP